MTIYYYDNPIPSICMAMLRSIGIGVGIGVSYFGKSSAINNIAYTTEYAGEYV